jgi:diguanylate cyclase (GGDEF)-like protein
VSDPIRKTDATSDGPVSGRRATRSAAPIRAKAATLGVLGVVGGAAVTLGQAWLGLPPWGLAVGLACVLGAIAWLAQAWVAAPMDDLVRRLELLARSARPQMLGDLPTERTDEIGRIARSVQRIAGEAVRNHHEARQLRQTLDHRVAIQTSQAVRQLKQMAMRDALTDLGNRRYLDEHLEQLVKVSLAAHSDVVCLMIDVDKFKQVNDTLGHQAGDELLTLIGGLIKASVRFDDLCVRLGGDEFVVLLAGATLARAEALAEGLRKHLGQQVRARFPDGPHADLSIGVASLLMDRCDTGERLLAMADARLYEAKRQGRGCTIGLDDRPVAARIEPSLQLAV